MYSTRDFTNGCDLWLAGICRYLNDAYAPIASKVLGLLTEVHWNELLNPFRLTNGKHPFTPYSPSLQMLEKGCSQYHRPVLRLLYEYLKLQDPKSREMRELGESIMTAVSQHIKVRRDGACCFTESDHACILKKCVTPLLGIVISRP